MARARTQVTANPVLVEVTRGPVVESRHRGAAVVVDADGAVVASWGDIDRPMVPRSAVKPLQAMAMVECGGAEKFALSDVELALACASHGGQPRHVAAVSNWLSRLGLGADDLVCGGHAPLHADAAWALAARGEKPSALHDNCSGKHAAMLSAALAMGVPAAGYQRPDHPVQRRIVDILGAMSGADIDPGDTGVDGCGAPTPAMPLVALAGAMARFGAPDKLGTARAAAARRLAAAMTAAPDMVAGDGRFDTVFMTAAPRIIVKGGAEGVHAAAFPARRLGIAVKIDDGATRAAEALMAALLDRFVGFQGRERRALARWLEPVVRSRTGEPVGRLNVMIEKD